MDKILQRGVSTIGDCKELVKKSSLRSPYQAEMGTWKAKAENETSVDCTLYIVQCTLSSETSSNKLIASAERD